MRKLAWLACCFALLGGCATIPYDSLKLGKFSGSVVVVWVGEGGSSGDGLFVFVPDPENPLTFRRENGRAPGAVIRPQIMYTDGGSIPRVAQVFEGFSPWGYAPAYMIHDWLFTARHCLIDGVKSLEYEQLKDVNFEESAKILGEAILALVEAKKVKRADQAGSTITNAVYSFVARESWDKKGACSESRVKPEHLAIARAAVSQDAVSQDIPEMQLRSARSAGRRTVGGEVPASGLVSPSRIVSRVTF